MIFAVRLIFPEIFMWQNLTPKIKALILDMDGVIWKGEQPIGDIKQIFDQISSLGLVFFFATNNSTLSAEMYVEKLLKFGIKIELEQIVNSSAVMSELLTKHFPSGGGLYIIGEKGLCATLSDFGFFHDIHHPQAVVVGMDRQVTYEKLAQATYFIRNGVPFYGTNPDLTFPTPNGLAPGAGSILAAIEAATGVQPCIVGKPQPMIINSILDRFQLHPLQVLVIGDRIDTDIQSGIKAGCRTALVLSGVSTSLDVESSEIKPDFIAKNLETLLFKIYD